MFLVSVAESFNVERRKRYNLIEKYNMLNVGNEQRPLTRTQQVETTQRLHMSLDVSSPQTPI